jgi:hypothetical protein
MAPPRIGMADRRDDEQQNAGNENNTPQHGTGPRNGITRMRARPGRIKAAAVHNLAFAILLAGLICINGATRKCAGLHICCG